MGRGARSGVARTFGLGRNRRLLVGLETEYEGVRGVDPDRLHVFLDSQIAPGYIAWVVPGLGVTQVGLACHELGQRSLDRLTVDVAPPGTRPRSPPFAGCRSTGLQGCS